MEWNVKRLIASTISLDYPAFETTRCILAPPLSDVSDRQSTYLGLFQADQSPAVAASAKGPRF